MNKGFSLRPEYKILRNIVLVFFALFLYSKTAWSADCGTISENTTNAVYNCAANDIFIVESGVTITKNSDLTVKIYSDDDNVTIHNNGTINNTFIGHGVLSKVFY